MMPEIKNRNLKFFVWGGRDFLQYTAADIVSVQAAISFMYLANQVKINVFFVL